MRKPKIDPILSALIAKLPASGAVWPIEQRTAWFEMLWMGCAIVYDGAPTKLPAPIKAREGDPRILPTGGTVTYPNAGIASSVPNPLPNFFIDPQGIARRADGERINPKDVNGNVIVDLRGEAGDLGSIQWADGSTGVRGHQLEITTSVS